MTNDRRLSMQERRCFACGAPIPDGHALYHAGYGMLLHHGGPCAAMVTGLERVYDRSPRGRWRPSAEVRQRVRMHRALQGLELSVIHADATEIYAMTGLHDFWYRGYVTLPMDVWRFDTTSEHVVSRAAAQAVIQDSRTHRYPLHLTTLDTLLRNWQHYGIWASWRPIGTALLQRWADLHGLAPHEVRP